MPRTLILMTDLFGLIQTTFMNVFPLTRIVMVAVLRELIPPSLSCPRDGRAVFPSAHLR